MGKKKKKSHPAAKERSPKKASRLYAIKKSENARNTAPSREVEAIAGPGKAVSVKSTIGKSLYEGKQI